MAVVEGGEYTKLLTLYKKGEDGEVTYGKNRYLAQTFTLTEEIAIFRIIVKMRSTYIWKPHLCALRATDITGKPLDYNITSHGQSKISSLEGKAAKWIITTFSDFPILSPGFYAIVLYSPEQADWLIVKWRADTTYPFYPGGKAWISHNAGEDWEEIPNTDFMFEVWGYHPPPEPPPTPVISNWALQKLEQKQLTDGYLFVAHTNIPCHLFMRWTTVEPEVHSIPVLRRGLALRTDKRFCFVVWEENEQQEDGDTLSHTFEKRDWPVCQTRWFYFVGTKQGEQQPSTGPIQKKHFTRIGDLLLFYEPWSEDGPPPPPEWTLIFEEPWSEAEPPPMLLFREEWSE